VRTKREPYIQTYKHTDIHTYIHLHTNICSLHMVTGFSENKERASRCEASKVPKKNEVIFLQFHCIFCNHLHVCVCVWWITPV